LRIFSGIVGVLEKSWQNLKTLIAILTGIGWIASIGL
jgi:hypothetical protein